MAEDLAKGVVWSCMLHGVLSAGPFPLHALPVAGGQSVALSAATLSCIKGHGVSCSDLQGYLANIDATAAEKALRELAVPFFHHEFVRQAVMQALHGADSEALIIELLGQLSECGLVSSNQLAKASGCSEEPCLTGRTCHVTPSIHSLFVACLWKTASLCRQDRPVFTEQYLYCTEKR